MPLTIKEISPTGAFIIRDEMGEPLGYGRARASTKSPGMVTLYFPKNALPYLDRGLRVPADWTKERIYIDSSKD